MNLIENGSLNSELCFRMKLVTLTAEFNHEFTENLKGDKDGMKISSSFE